MGAPRISPNSNRYPESMDSLVCLCARHVIAQDPLPTIPRSLYPVLFQVAFLDRRPLVLQDLVATWPFTELHFQQLMGDQELPQGEDCINCVQAIIKAVVAQVKRELKEPSRHSSLRVLNMTGLWGFMSGNILADMNVWYITEALAKACVEVSKDQQEFQRHGSKRHKGCSGADTATAAPQPLGVDIHADLTVYKTYYKIVHDALQASAAGPLRLKCREFQAENISASEIVTLLESLDPSCLRRVDLRCSFLRSTQLPVILPHLSRFPELRSLKLQHFLYVEHLTPESDSRIRCVARQLGMLPSLRELSVAPLESLEFHYCSLIPADLDFLSQSFHAPALKKLHLSSLDVSRGLLEPLRLLLEKTSASLLYLGLMECRMNDSHLDALLPTLRRCSRLRYLGLYGNSLSTAVLRDLLQKTLELQNLRLVVYPVPRDCYTQEVSEITGHFEEDEELLRAVTAEFSQILANSGRTNLVWTYDPDDHEAPDYFSLFRLFFHLISLF
ncbi:hypothetical protein IHE44_0001335 [Lamprotornis superbus]|uniref:Leucine-rich repeat-containing protein 14 n=1 Tax=Lamprotornis superbus TaxID=245042 RepID=A0A835ND72_9PASS|nr:hypothetical protein IHE44_0001335 [Lamprotornis superbus]